VNRNRILLAGEISRLELRLIADRSWLVLSWRPNLGQLLKGDPIAGIKDGAGPWGGRERLQDGDALAVISHGDGRSLAARTQRPVSACSCVIEMVFMAGSVAGHTRASSGEAAG
jgi:hypothetical protein